MLGSDQATIRWRSLLPGEGVVRFGTDAKQLSKFAYPNTPIASDHSVKLSQLEPNSTYFYDVFVDGQSIGNPELQYFTTAPRPDSRETMNFWVIGDAGTGNASQKQVLDSYLEFSKNAPSDLTLMLGDNAYFTGLDAEYQSNLYDVYGDFYRHQPFFTIFGNHDSYSTNPLTEAGPYFNNFDVPTLGELGGVASGTEAYYSFNYGNVHFISLDGNMIQSLLKGSAMVDWLEEDLKQNQQFWTIVMWHHPPYTKGSHDSDAEDELIYMREVVNPILEKYGVDLGLGGHSHNYERSYVMQGHYGMSETFNPEQHIVIPGTGNPELDGAYFKSDERGTIYIVNGTSGGQLGGGSMDHPAMLYSVDTIGSMHLSITDNRLESKFISFNGNVLDHFVMEKDKSLTGINEKPDPTEFNAQYDKIAQQLNLRYFAGQNNGTTLSVLNTTGQVIKELEWKHSGGYQTQVIGSENLDKGVYILRLQLESGVFSSHKVLIN